MSANDPLAAALAKIGDDVSRNRQAWQALPFAEKSAIRAGRGAGVLTFCAYVAVETRGKAALLLAIPALFGVLWLTAGVHGAQGARDAVRGVWYAIGALFSAALLWSQAYPADWGPTAAFWLCGVYMASLAATAMRCWLALRPMPQAKLPDPAKVPGMPMAGPATVRAAHAALRRRGATRRPKFRT